MDTRMTQTFAKYRRQGVAQAAGIILMLLVFLPGTVRSAYAGIHPVQLERFASDTKCLECHEDKTKGTNVHAAVSMGCLTCHLIRNSGDTTRVNLKTANSSTLCFECHADKRPGELPRSVHAPVTKDCLTCHDPHTSSNTHLLRKAPTGGKDDNLCLQCHTQGLQVAEKGSRHAALDMGCDTCHQTHKKRTIGEQDSEFLLNKKVPELCIGCHDPKDAALVKAHQGQPIAGADCTSCHDPHESKQPKLMRAYQHSPFGDRSCEMCHKPAVDGKVVLTQSNGRDLCATCHDDQAKKIDGAKVPHVGAQGDCTQCHNPHAGKYPKFVRNSPSAVCESCHPGEKEIEDTKKVLHGPAYDQGCSVCHNPHGGEHEHLLRATGNELCLSCHGVGRDETASKAAGDAPLMIFGTVEVPKNYFDEVPVLRLDAKGLGHPEVRHPVGNVLDPTDPKKERMISCLTCHLPHGGGKAMLVTGQDNSGSLCATCHKFLHSTNPTPASAASKPGTAKRGRSKE